MVEQLNKKQLELLWILKNEFPETYEHSIQVSNYSVSLGKYINLPEEDLYKLQIAGLFHDIGKIKISKDIINKPGKLTEEEYKQVKDHPVLSVDLLRSTGFTDETVLNIILSHHERPDGKGYPKHLEDHKIERLAKIISIVDSYSAIVSNRIYSPTRSMGFAFSELLRNSGTQFDGSLVFNFVNLLHAKRNMMESAER